MERPWKEGEGERTGVAERRERGFPKLRGREGGGAGRRVEVDKVGLGAQDLRVKGRERSRSGRGEGKG